MVSADIKIREFSEEDYGLLSGWWESRGWGIPALRTLPQTGFIVNDCVAGFLYTTDSTIGWVEWIISDPKAEGSNRDRSLDVLMGLLIEAGEMLGCDLLFTSLEHASLIERYKRHGFQVTDKGVTNLMRRI